MAPNSGNGEAPVNIRTLYDLVKRLDEKVDAHQETLAILVHELKRPPAPCPRNPDVHDAMKQAFHAEMLTENHEKRLVVIERIIAAIVAMGGLALAALGKLLYDLLSGTARIIWQ